MRVSRRVAVVGLNVSISVFVGFSAYGFLEYFGGGFTVPSSTLSTPALIASAALIVASVAGMYFFGHQVDLWNLAKYREEEARKAAEGAKPGGRKPLGRG